MAIFDALRYTKELEGAGFSRDQAQATVRVLMDGMIDNFATKDDLKVFATKEELRDVEFSVRRDIQALDAKIERVEYRLTIKLGSIIVAWTSILAAFVRFTI